MRRLIAGAGVLALSFALPFSPVSGSGAGASAPSQLRVGRLELAKCTGIHDTWCGDLPVPLDRTDPQSPTIPIHFQWRPAGARAEGTIVAVEGGPGYPSTWTRDQYLPLFLALLPNRNLLLVDQRGTGQSAPVTCPALQHFKYTEPNTEWTRLVGVCGRALDHTYRRADGSYVQASQLFGSANAARDLESVLDALQTGPIDLYGDSYGTYFEQAFATRFASSLRSIVLDGAYPALALNPWYPTTATRARTALDLVCSRDVACSALPGTSTDRLDQLVATLRRAPYMGTTTTPHGAAITVRLDPQAIAVLLNNAAGDNGDIYRDFDSAARAYLDHHDAAPLLRLVAEGTERGDSGSLHFYSAGMYAATTCHDYPAAFSLTASPAKRRVEWQRAEARYAARHPNAYAPFTVNEWLTTPVEDDEEYDACLDWPAQTQSDPAVASSLPLLPPTVPALVLSSDLDSWTPAPGGKVLTRQLGPSAHWLLVPNTLHVSGLLDDVGCATGIVDAFIVAPASVGHIDTSCLARVPERHTAGDDIVHAASARAATPGSGNDAAANALRLATVAVDTVGDVVAQDAYVDDGTGIGLRGGTFTAVGTKTRSIALRGIRFASDAPVDGSVQWVRDRRSVVAHVTVTGPDGTLSVDIAWNGLVPHAPATVTGTATPSAGAAVHISATVPAP
jgi:pimeloyl-ACP methyl ester carboxylesterase